MKSPMNSQRKVMSMTILLVALAVAGCSDTEHYPISGAACGPDDPVHELDAMPCVPPAL